MKPKPYRIFRAGQHTDSAGQVTTFTREQLEAMVTAYNDGAWRAPMVVGHPTGTAPAYGWVAKLSINDKDEVLVDDTEQLNSDFAELIKSGAYRNRSASLYAPDHPNNPTPGVWQLRHLGFLGAQPPAIKGLGDVEFGDADGVTVDFADYSMSSIAALFRGLRELVIGKFGVEDADKALSNFLIVDIEQAGRETVAETTPNYSEAPTMTPEEIAALKAKAEKADQLESENATLKAQTASFEESQKAARHAVALVDAKAALQPLVEAGKLLPAQLDQAANFMVGLDDQAKTFEFGEATGENALTARAFFAKLLDQAPKAVDYQEHTADTTLPGSMKPGELATKAREYQDAMAAKGVTITSTAAVDAVMAGKTA